MNLQLFRSRTLPLLSALLLALVGLSVLNPLRASSFSAASSAALKTLSDRWQKAQVSLGVPGFAVAVVRNDEVLLLEGYGHRDLAGTKTVTPETLFYIASSTKSFTAFCVLHLADKGRLDLDDAVVKSLPRFRMAGRRPSTPITVRDLLSHRRGLSGELPLSLHEAFTGVALRDDTFYSTLRAYVQETGRFRYGNLHYTLLGRIIESASGKHWKSYLREEILGPAGLDRTTPSIEFALSLGNVAEMIERRAGNELRSPALTKCEGSMSAAGGLYSTAKDLARWLSLHLGAGRIGNRRLLHEDTVKELRSPQVPVGSSFFDFEREHYGLGWYVGSYRGRVLLQSFGGFSGGARSHLSFMPEEGLGVVALVNVNKGPGNFLMDAIAADTYDTLLGLPSEGDRLAELHEFEERTPIKSVGGFAVPSRRNNPAVATGALSLAPKSYVGTYRDVKFGEVEVFFENEELGLRYGGIRQIGLTSFQGPDQFLAFLLPGKLLVPGQFVVQNDRVSRLILDLPGTPDGVATFSRH